MFVGFHNKSPLLTMIKWMLRLVRTCLCGCCKRDLGVCNRKNMQLVLQHCCKTSEIAMLRVKPPTNQTWLATNQVVASCVNTDFWLDNIKQESRSTRELRHLLQNMYRFCCTKYNYYLLTVTIFTSCNNLNCCKKGLNLTSKTRNIAFKLILQQCGKNKQIALISCLFYRTFKRRRTITNYRGTVIKNKSKRLCWGKWKGVGTGKIQLEELYQ